MKTRMILILILLAAILLLSANLIWQANRNASQMTEPSTDLSENGTVPPVLNEIEPTHTVDEALAIARASKTCTSEGSVGAFEVYNPSSGTWWFTLDAEMGGCSPACVVADRDESTEINWRCTGLQP